jgi:hypothetical protein
MVRYICWGIQALGSLCHIVHYTNPFFGLSYFNPIYTFLFIIGNQSCLPFRLTPDLKFLLFIETQYLYSVIFWHTFEIICHVICSGLILCIPCFSFGFWEDVCLKLTFSCLIFICKSKRETVLIMKRTFKQCQW